MTRSHVRAERGGSAAGWRVWRVIRNVEDGRPALASSEREFLWHDRSVRAQCLPPSLHFGVSDWYRNQRRIPNHAAPAVVCECGIHAYWSQADAFDDFSLGRGTLRAVGAVELSERMIGTETGVRAEAARIVGPIWLAGECGVARADRSDCGTVKKISTATFAARCADHGPPDWDDADEAIWRLRQQLENRYQVEVNSSVRVAQRHE